MAKIGPDLQVHITRAFAPLRDQAAAIALPPPGSLSQALKAAIPASSAGLPNAYMPRVVAKMFTTAAVDVWMRAVHSFLISASLTDVSPIWASVSGYYSSHYSVRSIAHLLGFFQLFSEKRIVQLQFQGGQYLCSFNRKTKLDREHRFYWKIVKLNPLFAADPFFTQNDSSINDSPSDLGHRDRANYADHLSQFSVFRPLDAAALKARINRISEIEFKSPPIPRISKFPDVESVQVIAYHRLVRFRDLVDTIIGNSNRFWNVHRNPAWARDFMDFQLTEEATLHSQFTL